MGYTLSVTPKSSKMREKLIHFAKQHFRPWSIIIQNVSSEMFFWVGGNRWEGEILPQLLSGRDLAYDDHPGRIGFNVHYSEYEREYLGALIRWIAIQCGKKQKGIPIVYHDGDERLPVNPDNFDKIGWYSVPYWHTHSMFFPFSYLFFPVNALRAELQRLSDLWETFEVDEVK